MKNLPVVGVAVISGILGLLIVPSALYAIWLKGGSAYPLGKLLTFGALLGSLAVGGAVGIVLEDREASKGDARTGKLSRRHYLYCSMMGIIGAIAVLFSAL